jgi:hypothetical protein
VITGGGPVFLGATVQAVTPPPACAAPFSVPVACLLAAILRLGLRGAMPEPGPNRTPSRRREPRSSGTHPRLHGGEPLRRASAAVGRRRSNRRGRGVGNTRARSLGKDRSPRTGDRRRISPARSAASGLCDGRIVAWRTKRQPRLPPIGPSSRRATCSTPRAGLGRRGTRGR